MTPEQFTELHQKSIELIDQFFPKLNIDDPSKPSPNHRLEAIALVSVILHQIAPIVNKD